VAQGQGGLLDVNIDPDFAKNRMIFWDYAEATNGGNVLAIAKGKLAADESSIEDIQVIYRALPAYRGPLQYGSRILFDKQGNLFVSNGERSGADIRMKAQDLDAAIGKVIHITKTVWLLRVVRLSASRTPCPRSSLTVSVTRRA
jgi:glucose/arabinose dehydrogenase